MLNLFVSLDVSLVVAYCNVPNVIGTRLQSIPSFIRGKRTRCVIHNFYHASGVLETLRAGRALELKKRNLQFRQRAITNLVKFVTSTSYRAVTMY